MKLGMFMHPIHDYRRGYHTLLNEDLDVIRCADAVGQGLSQLGNAISIIDPVPSTGRVAAALVASGLGHSKVAYQTPPAKPVTGYDMPDLHGFRNAAD